MLVGVKVEVGVKVTVNVVEGVNVSEGRGVSVTVGLKVTVYVSVGVGVGEISSMDVMISPPVFGMSTVEFRRSFSDPPKNRYGKPKPSKQTASNTRAKITVKLLSFIPALLLLLDPASQPYIFHISHSFFDLPTL